MKVSCASTRNVRQPISQISIERFVAALEIRDLREWITGFVHGERLERERRGFGRHFDFGEAPGAPPQRRERPPRSVGNEGVKVCPTPCDRR